MSLDGIRGAGIERESAFALYGNGILPVLRFELSDADLFDAAIDRIDNKTFGICEAIGAPISMERLEATPWAKYSLDGARKMDRGEFAS